jgi:hypothetical protein
MPSRTNAEQEDPEHEEIIPQRTATRAGESSKRQKELIEFRESGDPLNAAFLS